jgi:hypothetical protein
MALILNHQTPQQFIVRFRQAYQEGQRERLVKLAAFILARIAAGDITDAQCRSAFNLTVAQWNNLKTKMQTLINNFNAVQSAVGE